VPPEGTIALLFTDIEGSTRLATKLGPDWRSVLADHHTLIGGAIDAEGGYVDGKEGDAFFATFVDARAAARAAVNALQALRRHSWPPEVGELKVRMGLHVGYVERADTGYVGLEVHRAARVSAAAHGGQLLLTTSARELVGDVLATEPLGSHRLKDFPGAVHLFCAVVDGRGASAYPPPRTEEIRPTNLPAGLPVLIGRDDDVTRVRDALLVEAERVVTLTGRGGAGKTSLALVVAASLLDEYPGGVWLARLANVERAQDVTPAVASAVGVTGDLDSSASQAIVTRLRERGRTLLVLDNLEHLSGAAPDIGELVDALPQLSVLITSQVPSRLAAEICVPLDALDDDAALALLERVARRRRATFSVAGDDRGVLLDVVHFLDGLPLALELAAARLALLTPTQLRDRLRASHEVLRDDRSDRPDRHRSLQATVDWTLSLLEQDAVQLFDRMGTFAGPVELEDIEAVAGADGLDVLGQLAVLLDVALVRRVEAGDARIRFGLPEALRQIAAARLDADAEGEEWRRVHARHYRDLFWAVRPIFVSRSVYERAAGADPEVAAAVRWAREVGDPVAAPLAAARGMFLADIGRVREALAMVEPVIESPPDDVTVHAQALTAHSCAMSASGRLAEGLASGEQAVALAPDPMSRALALNMRGLARGFGGDYDAALRDSEEATRISRELGPAMLCGALLIEAQARQFAGQLDRAVEILAEAERVGEESDSAFLWRQHTVRGDLAALSGRPSDALGHYADSLEIAEARGNEAQVLFDLMGVADTLGGLGVDEDALLVGGMAAQQISELGGPEASGVHLLGQEGIAAARQRAGAVVAADWDARGRAVPAAQRVARACLLARADRLATTAGG
jgi:predicted ATPase/class 3 adenylate cyclase